MTTLEKRAIKNIQEILTVAASELGDHKFKTYKVLGESESEKNDDLERSLNPIIDQIRIAEEWSISIINSWNE